LLFCILVNAAHTTVTLLLDPSFVLAGKLDMVNMFQNTTDGVSDEKRNFWL
jgi:hypothetical protein